MERVLEKLYGLAEKHMNHTELYHAYADKATCAKEQLASSLPDCTKQELWKLIDHYETLQGLSASEFFKAGVACGYNLANELGMYRGDED